MSVNLQFYTLLHFEFGKKQSPNLAGSVLKTYLKNCVTLSRSLEKHGYSLVIITNIKDYVFGKTGITCKEIEFDLDLPDDIPFYSAHFKISVFNYFASLASSNYSILLDSDILCLRRLSMRTQRIISNGNPLLYDISSQITNVYGENRIKNDKLKLSGRDLNERWIGGEFIGGDCEFYRKLVIQIDRIWPEYVNVWPTLHHVGDEMLTTVAVDMIEQDIDIISNNEILRYWSVATMHKQVSITSLKKTAIVHLPSDKKILHLLANRRVWLYFYPSYALCRQFLSRIKRKLSKYISM